MLGVEGAGGLVLSQSPLVSVILPAYNERGRIGETLTRLSDVLGEMGVSYEIIVVDDGSVDGTGEVVQRFGDGSVKLVSYGRNEGKGYALRRGFMESSGRYVVFMDSDMDVDPGQVKLYVRALEHADVVIGSKWHPKSRVETSFLRKFLSRSFYALARLLVGIRVSDTQVGLKAFRREALEKIVRVQLVKRYAFDVELLALASLLKLRIVELPVNLRLEGSFDLREVFRMFLDVLGIAYRLRVSKWYQRSIGVFG